MRKTKIADLSPSGQAIAKEYNFNCESVPKLVADLKRKTDYPIYYLNLQKALHYGYRLIKIKSIISAKMTKFLEPYIEKNTEMRNSSKNESSKNYFKLKNNR